MAGDEHDGQGGLAGDQRFLQFKAAHAGHANVDDEYADLFGVVGLQEFFRAAEALDAVAVCFEQPAQGVTYRFVIIDNVNRARGLGGRHALCSWISSCVSGLPSGAQGRVKRNMVPPSGFWSAHRRPWCDSMMVRQILSPIPSPSDLVL